jgi:two-component system response regulator HydG
MNILYVDDEVDLLELAKTFFEDEGLSLETSANFTEALNLIRNKKFNLIIADVRMPTGTGIELVHIARSEDKFDGKFILVSGDLKSQAEIEKAGVDLMMTKPLNFFDLAEAAKKLLQNQ